MNYRSRIQIVSNLLWIGLVCSTAFAQTIRGDSASESQSIPPIPQLLTPPEIPTIPHDLFDELLTLNGHNMHIEHGAYTLKIKNNVVKLRSGKRRLIHRKLRRISHKTRRLNHKMRRLKHNMRRLQHRMKRLKYMKMNKTPNKTPTTQIGTSQT